MVYAPPPVGRFLLDWINFFVSLVVTAVEWMHNTTFLNIPLIGFIAACFVMGVTLRALLIKA